MQRAILASLLDLPDSVSKEEEIKKVKLEIVKIQRRLADARNQGGGILAILALTCVAIVLCFCSVLQCFC